MMIRSRYILTLLLALLLILNCFDYFLTVYGAGKGLVEINPVSKELIENGGFAKVKLVYVNATIIAAMCLALTLEAWLGSNSELAGVMPLYRCAVFIILTAVIMYVFVVITNVSLILTS